MASLEEQLKLFQDRVKDQEKAFDEQSTRLLIFSKKLRKRKRALILSS